MTEAFDPLKALAKRAAASIDGTGRKLTLFDKCAAFACLYGGTKSSVVAKAFGLSSASVSYLAGCRPIDDRRPMTISFDVRQQATDDKGYLLVEPAPDNKESFPPAQRTPIMVTKTITETITPTNLNMRRSSDRKPRYQDVAREFDRLGEEMFLRTYYTADIDARIERIERNRPKPGDDRTPFSSNPKSELPTLTCITLASINSASRNASALSATQSKGGCTPDATLTNRNSASNGAGSATTTTSHSAPRRRLTSIICDSPIEWLDLPGPSTGLRLFRKDKLRFRFLVID